MIDQSTGELILKGAVRVGRWLTRRQFLSSPLYRQATGLIHNEGWHSYGLEATGINQQKLFITLQFLDSTLKWIDFVVDGGDDLNEAGQKRLHDELLEQWLGAGPYAYAWGRVTSDYDPRSDTSSIFVGYEGNDWPLLRRLFGRRG
jgi:hypothetical protein